MGKFRIGISGWRYAPWRGVFYPADLVQRDELAYASRALATIEINGTFYALQNPASYQQWYAATPHAFVFAVKAPRYITHIRRLNDVALPMANFFASGVLCLKQKLGPLLWQLPPSFVYDEEVLEAFLSLLPHDTNAMSAIARQHDTHIDKVQLSTDKNRRVRHAIEIRHPSFATETFIAQLRRYRIALVVADTAGKWPLLEDVTADFMYLRLHGDKKLYASGYSEEALEDWCRRIRAWARGSQPQGARRCSTQSPPKRSHRDIYVYFDNDIKVKAPFDAQRLADMLTGTKKSSYR